MSDKNEIMWRREHSKLVHLNYVSTCGRWLIVHPKNDPHGRWALYDNERRIPHVAGWATLNMAKQNAYQLQRTGR